MFKKGRLRKALKFYRKYIIITAITLAIAIGFSVFSMAYASMYEDIWGDEAYTNENGDFMLYEATLDANGNIARDANGQPISYSLHTKKTWADSSSSMFDNACGMVERIAGVDDMQEVTDKLAVNFDDETNAVDIGGVEITDMADMIKAINEFIWIVAALVICVSFISGWINTRENDMGGDMVLRQMAIWGISLGLSFISMHICFYIGNIGTGVTDAVIEYKNENSVALDTAVMDVERQMYKSVYSDDANYHFNDLYLNNQSNNLHWYNFGSNVSNAMDSFMSTMGKTMQNIGNYASILSLQAKLFLPWIICWVANLIINVICWSRGIEMLTLAVFSPLAFTDVSDTNSFGRGSGMRFLRNFAALALTGAIILMELIVTSYISAAIIGDTSVSGFDFWTVIPSLAVVGVVKCGLVMKAQGIAKTLCGVG